MKRIIPVLFSIAALCFGAAPAESAEFVFKLAHNLPAPDSSYHRASLFFKEQLEKHSNGKATLIIYPAGQLGSDVNVAKKLQAGTFDFEILSTNKLGNFYGPIDIYSLPFIFPDFDAVSKVVKTEQHAMIMDDMGKKAGLKNLAFIGSGFRNITNSRHPVNVPADVASLKMRVPQNRVEIAMFRALGASAIPVSDGELFTALQQGLVDGQDGSALWAFSKKIYEVQKYMSTTAHQLSCSTLVVSSKVFSKLPADIQQAIIKAGAETEIFWQKDAKEENQIVMTRFKERGMTINEPNKAAFMQAMQSVYEEFAEEVGGMERIKNIQQAIK